jgi:DNA-binding FadR family transcriptional regulator
MFWPNSLKKTTTRGSSSGNTFLRSAAIAADGTAVVRLCGPKVAELAASRLGKTDSATVGGLLERSLAALAAEQDSVARQRHAMEFWDHVVDAADSIVFRLMFNMLRAAYEPALVAPAPMMSAEVGNVGAATARSRRAPRCCR